MDNYSYNSYPDSGNSSPRGSQSHEIDFENTPSWEQENYKVKFMCSYGGKIIPRPHDNQLCYSGGETKILAVDRSIKFTALISKLSSLCGDSSDVSFKYQLPGEDLDALISVTNDDDLDHMMHEYDRLYRGGASSARPARMRLFLFPTTTTSLSHHQQHDSFGSDSSAASFLEALNSGPIPKPPVQNNVDLLYGLGKGVAAVSSPPPPPQPTIPENVPPQARSGNRDRDVVGLDPAVEFQRRLQIGSDQPPDHQQQAMYPKAKMEDNLVRGYSGPTASGDYYMQKLPEKQLAPAVTAPPPAAGYWPEKHVSSVGYPGSSTVMGAPEQQQPMYMISAAGGGGGVYHAPNPPMVRGVTAPVSQGLGYYHHMQQQQQPQQQRMAMAADVYREQPVYNVVPPPHPHQQQAPPKYVATYAETAPYTQVAYDGATGRQVYYTAPGGTVPYSSVGPAAVGGEMRVAAGGLSQEGKVVGSKVPQT